MDYRFKPISKKCAGTGEPLEPGTVCYSVLIEQDGVYERHDYSEAGWQGLPEDSVGFWQCVVPYPEKRDVATMDAEVLLQYFEQLEEDNNPSQEKIRYVLALYLLQKRRLKLESSTTVDGIEMLHIIGTRGEGPFDVKDQQLSQEEMTALQAALNQQLTEEWNAA